MLISKTDSNAIAIVRSVAQNGLITATKIAEQEDIPLKFCQGISSKLKRKGILISYQGSTNCGYSLSRDPEEISVLDVIAAMSDASDKIYSEEKNFVCASSGNTEGRVGKYYQHLHSSILSLLSTASIADLM